MAYELQILFATCILGLIHISAASFSFKAQAGNRYTVGPRDEGLVPRGLAGRLQRAQSNFMETFPIFLACIFMIVTTENAGVLSHWGTTIYLAGRILYLPLYAVGVPWLRTFSWNFATFGLVLTGAQLLFPMPESGAV